MSSFNRESTKAVHLSGDAPLKVKVVVDVVDLISGTLPWPVVGIFDGDVAVVHDDCLLGHALDMLLRESGGRQTRVRRALINKMANIRDNTSHGIILLRTCQCPYQSPRECPNALRLGVHAHDEPVASSSVHHRASRTQADAKDDIHHLNEAVVNPNKS